MSRVFFATHEPVQAFEISLPLCVHYLNAMDYTSIGEKGVQNGVRFDTKGVAAVCGRFLASTPEKRAGFRDFLQKLQWLSTSAKSRYVCCIYIESPVPPDTERDPAFQRFMQTVLYKSLRTHYRNARGEFSRE